MISSTPAAGYNVSIKYLRNSVKTNQNDPLSVAESDIKEVLNRSEVERAKKMYVQLTQMHQAHPPAFYISIDQKSRLNTLIGFRKSGSREPVLMYIKDDPGVKSRKGGGFGSVYQSHRLSRISDDYWVLRCGSEYERVIKIQDEGAVAQSEAQFQIDQDGTLGTGVVDGKRYLDQVRVPGSDLAEHFKRGEWTESQRVKCAVSILLYLVSYVASGHLHPDVKPDNMMYEPESGDVLLIDQAHVVNTLENPSTPACSPLYTSFYASPEQYRSGIISEKTMVYSAGITLLNLLSDNPSLYDVARSVPETQRGIRLDLTKVLPKLAEKDGLLVSGLKDVLLDMVAKNEKERPTMQICLDRLRIWVRVFDLQLKHSDEIKTKQDELNILQNQLKKLKENKFRESSKAKDQKQKEEAIQTLKKQCQAQEEFIADTLEQYEVDLKAANEPLQRELDQVRLQNAELKEKEDLRNRELRKVKASKSELLEKLNQLTQQVTEIESSSSKHQSDILDRDKKLSELGAHITEAKMRLKQEESSRKEAVKVSMKLKSDLINQEQIHKEKTKELDEVSKIANQLKSVHQATIVELNAAQQEIASQQRAPLQKMLKHARDNPSGAKDQFIELLPGTVRSLPIKTRAELLTKLFVRIITNEKMAGGDSLPYMPPVSWFWTPERQFNPSATQTAHLQAIQREAEELFKTGLNGDVESRKLVCQWLDKSPVFSCPNGSSLKGGFTFYHRMQSLLSGVPEGWKYRDKGGQPPQWLADQLHDGRQGEPGNPKSVSDFMVQLSKSVSLEAAGMQLFRELKIHSFAEKMKLLEAAFSRVILSAGAYTRGDAFSGAYFPPRQDIAGASRTQIEHAEIFQNIARQLIDERGSAGVKLSPEEIGLLCQSRLLKFNPVQYHSKVESCPSEYAIAAQELCESSQNVDELKRYYLNTTVD